MKIYLVACVMLAVATGVTGCASGRESAAQLQPLAPGVTLSLPATPAFGDGDDVMQLVQARYQGHQQMFQSLIRSKADHFTVVMSVPSGPRIMRIDWTKGGVTAKKETLAPGGLSPERMLADLMLVYGSADDVRRSIDGAFFIETYRTERKVIKDGKLLIMVARPKGDVWNGRASLINYAFDYQLIIQSQRATDD
ncbi:MAG: DUF3261 domain-containing protein [Pseudomonadota bacterium]